MKVQWSPIDPNKFLTYSNNVITLYETKEHEGQTIPNGSFVISENHYAKNLAMLSDIPLMKCVAWYPGNDKENLIAVGHANGKILLSNFGQTGECNLAGKELVPKHLRQCSYMAWNPVYHHLLAEGLDKHRNDCCISVWDVNQRVNTDIPMSFERQRYSTTLGENAVFKPNVEVGMGETSSSFAWFNKEPSMFVAGMNQKCLRIYDVRDSTKPHLVAHTKFVSGVCTDTLDETRIASYSESHVAIWDFRTFDKPMLTLQADKNVMKIRWSPMRTGVLAVLARESHVVKLYDIRHSLTGTEEFEPVIFERSLQPDRQHTVAHFAWHPMCENRIMTVTSTGSLKDNQIFEKLPMSLSPSMNLAWVFGRQFSIADYGSEVDMAARMKQRALREYGLHREDLWHNAEVVRDEPQLHALWHWLDLTTTLLRSEDGSRRHKSSRFIGVLDLLSVDKLERPSNLASNSWQYPDGSRSNSRERTLVNQYKSEPRSRALQLCGWWYDTRDGGDPLLQLLDSLVNNNKEYERAAAIALFNLKIGKALQILSSESAVEENPTLTSVAMALSGFTEERNAMWRKTCYELRNSLRNPYLRAMFSFLACDRDNYEEVLTDDICMAVKDRVAFACIYLNDSKLSVYLKELSKQLKQCGNLDGVLLTGLTNEDGLELLGQYVDLTSDIQSVTLAIIYSAPSELTRDDRVQTWIDSYRELLDRWQLWHQRAKFDIIRNSLDNNRVQGQAFVSCNYCGKSVACNMTLASRSRSNNFTMLPPTNKPKISCCPGCRKPLPRCALCLTNLGTPSGSALFQKDKSELEKKLSPFDSWFTWCQTCRHGGHSLHITDWFREHIECPVTGCRCKCNILDPSSQLTAETSNLRLVAAEN